MLYECMYVPVMYRSNHGARSLQLFCGGKLVSQYVRRQHCRRYGSRVTEEKTSMPVQPTSESPLVVSVL